MENACLTLITIDTFFLFFFLFNSFRLFFCYYFLLLPFAVALLLTQIFPLKQISTILVIVFRVLIEFVVETEDGKRKTKNEKVIYVVSIHWVF